MKGNRMDCMEWLLNFGWRAAMPFVKAYCRIFKKCEFARHSYLSYLTRLAGHNHIGRDAYVLGSHMGYGSSVADNGYFFNAVIGKYTCIGPRSAVIAGRHPTDAFVSIHPAFFSAGKKIGLSYTDRQLFREYAYVGDTGKSVVIGNDVWVGADVKIMEGITVGDGAVLGAGALVTRNVEPYEIVAGVPAKHIRYRFEESDREWLLQLKWWDKTETWIRKNAQYFSDVKALKSAQQNDCEIK